ncbi:putative uncharacterized protein [Parachlamydia acanthamoebae UV-7]|jgi:trans-aconitate methyltransferase|uniref:Methyltransferase domain-containing protein n=2 Tax=Parachlamydia acanthamoebae TaxID=83552 RepID=F8KYK4_PARAV|nr:class I SAM-dependent methyltransferase [Parachlamydia acanthamoebae]EFB41179.1 hypothetical protein pah_c050o170 [Parachlamydia acanthamoebae str. Hall's coccus]CCB85959.1 putative uncharacterized protein [Parachlamydia acanthamoebae UV-7]
MVAAGDLDAKHYKKNSILQYALAQDPLNYFPFTGNENVLDIGCGDGKITAEIAKKIPNGFAIGIDKSPGMIHLAKQSFSNVEYPNLDFQIQDAVQLPFEQSFDLITSFSCLHWVKNQKAVFQQMKQLLNYGGKAIIVTFPRCLTFWDPIEAVADHPKWRNYFLQDPRPYEFLDQNAYSQVVQEAGLKMLHIETSSHAAKFHGKKGFEDYVRGWLPFLIALPKEFHDPFLDEIGNKSLEFIPVSEDGCVYHPYEKISMILEQNTFTGYLSF